MQSLARSMGSFTMVKGRGVSIYKALHDVHDICYQHQQSLHSPAYSKILKHNRSIPEFPQIALSYALLHLLEQIFVFNSLLHLSILYHKSPLFHNDQDHFSQHGEPLPLRLRRLRQNPPPPLLESKSSGLRSLHQHSEPGYVGLPLL